MRISRQQPEVDLCQTSIDLLKERCRSWLVEQGFSGPVWFPDDHSPYPVGLPDPSMDVVLFGGFLRRVLESGNWLRSRHRLWVLSSATREVMIRLLGFPADSIGVIPREDLFPMKGVPRPFPRPGEPFTFVFGGRISETKNIPLLIETVRILQNDHHWPVSLDLVGDFDDQGHPDRGRRVPENFRHAVEAQIRTLPWTDPPRICGSASPLRWPDLARPNPVFISLSTFVYEDFGVAQAQAQARGWPSILSDWGGHRDAGGDSVLRIHPLDLGHAHESGPLTALRAKLLARQIRCFLENPSTESKPPRIGQAAPVPAPPRSLSTEELDVIRRKLLKTAGTALAQIIREGAPGRGGMEIFSETREGREFLARYRALFSGLLEEAPMVLIVNDLHPSEDPSFSRVAEICHFIVDQAGKNGTRILLYPLEELPQHALSTPLLNASSIVFPFYHPTLDPVLESWIRRIDIPATLHIFTRDPGELKTLLRPQDRIFPAGDRSRWPA